MKKCIILGIKGFDPEFVQAFGNKLPNWERLFTDAVSGVLINRVPVSWELGFSQALCGVQVHETALARHLTDIYPGMGLTVAAYGFPVESADIHDEASLKALLDEDNMRMKEAVKQAVHRDLTVIALAGFEAFLGRDEGELYLSKTDTALGELLD